MRTVLLGLDSRYYSKHITKTTSMQTARQVSLIICISLWAIIIGGIVYSHIVYFPPYLSNLPESSAMVKGDYGLHEENFWMFIHPLNILFTILALILYWKIPQRRKWIAIALVIYVLVIIVTAFYFLPGLSAFADSSNQPGISAEEWDKRGQTWQQLSWVRGVFMYLAFLSLLIALTKRNINHPTHPLTM